MNASFPLHLLHRAPAKTTPLARPASNKKLAAALLLLGALPALAVPNFLSFTSDGSFSGWTTYGSVSASSSTGTVQLGTNTYYITPATGTYMAKISPSGTTTNVDSLLGLTSGTMNTLFTTGLGSSQATNYGILTETITLGAGTYQFAWSFGNNDYNPYNDGVLFALAGNGTNEVSVLACSGPNAPQADTLILGDYGFAPWATHAFTIATTGTYQLSFASYNWKDTSQNPSFYIGSTVGTISEASPTTNIDTAASSYLASNLGTSLNPAFTGGTLVANVPTVAANFTVNASGGTIQSSGNTASVFSGVISNSESGAGPITITSDGAGGSIVFTGASTYTGSTSIASGATLQLSGTGSLASPTITIATGGTLLDSNGGLAPTAAVTANGLFSLGSNESIASLSGSGSVALGANSLTVGSGSFSGGISGAGSLLTSGSGTLVFTGANTYTGPTTIAAGTALQLSGNGSLATPTITINTGGTLFDNNGGLASTSIITANGQLSLGANQTIGSLAGSGAVGLGANTITVGNGTFGGVISGSGALQVTGEGVLILTGTNTYTGPTTVTQGQLILNGSLAGNVTVANAGILGGYGTIHGSLTASGGIVSPGSSPGILTVGGNYTEAGTLRIEIDGTAGAGVNPGGHDQIAVGGTATLQSGSTLQLTRTNTFEPTWGQRFRVIDATGGISGTFSTLDRSAFSTQLFFDYGTGQVYGTGLAAGAPVGQFAGTSANRGAVLGAILRDALSADSTGQLSFLDSRTAGGSFLKSLFDNSAPRAVLDVLSPVAYAGTVDYALQVTRNFSRDIHNVPTLASANGWTLSAGYTGYRNGLSKAAADDTNTDLRSNAAVVDVGRKLGEHLTIGGFFAADDGAILARRFSSDVTGQAVGLHLSWQPWTERRISLEGGASYATYDFDNRRATTLGIATSKTDADVYDLWGRAKAGVYHTDRLGLSAFTGIAYTHATVSRFGERGVGDALAVGEIKDELVVGDIGAELSLLLGSRIQLIGEAALEHNFQEPRREVFARFTDSATLFRVTAHGFDEDAVRGGLRVEYALSERTKLSAHYSAAVSSSSEAAQTFGAKLQYRF
jgi:autotransporter-associated beta strand protein